MNPGTTILILLGIIGLLLYASKAFVVDSAEGFSPVDESQISNVGKTALENLTQGPNGLTALLGAFSTPDITTPPPVAGLPSSLEAGPSLSALAERAVATAPVEPPTAATAGPGPVQQAPVPATALPVNAPLSALGTTPPSPTTSDLQGSGLLTAAPPSADPTPAAAPLPLVLATPEGPTLSDLQGAALTTPPPPKTLPQAVLSDVAASASIAPPSYRPPVPAQCPPPVKCPPMPDMSMYVRKDQIPCWGCNLK